MKKLMTFITLSAIAISNYAQANEQPHQAHMNMQMSTGSAMLWGGVSFVIDI